MHFLIHKKELEVSVLLEIDLEEVMEIHPSSTTKGRFVFPLLLASNPFLSLGRLLFYRELKLLCALLLVVHKRECTGCVHYFDH